MSIALKILDCYWSREPLPVDPVLFTLNPSLLSTPPIQLSSHITFALDDSIPLHSGIQYGETLSLLLYAWHMDCCVPPIQSGYTRGIPTVELDVRDRAIGWGVYRVVDTPEGVRHE